MTIYTGSDSEKALVRQILREMKNTGDISVFSLEEDGIIERFNLPGGTIAYMSKKYLREIATFIKTGPPGFESLPPFYDFDVKFDGFENLTPQKLAEIRLMTATRLPDLQDAGAVFVSKLPHTGTAIYEHELFPGRLFYFETWREGLCKFKKIMP